MESFAIICTSCAARLKVKDSTAIGQKLACPKCGEMLLVEPPEGNHVSVSSNDGSGSTAQSDADFEDVDQLLANPKTLNRPISPPKTSAKHSKRNQSHSSEEGGADPQRMMKARFRQNR